MTAHGTVRVATPHATLNRKGLARFRSGHPWIFRAHIEPPPPDLPAGVVAVADPRGVRVGAALYSPQSKIALRTLTRDAAEPDEAFFRARIARAWAYRKTLGIDGSAFRVLYAEGDGLPGLVADWYDGHLVVMVQSAALDAHPELWLPALEEIAAPRSILARNDSASRALEGLPREVTPLRGTPPPTAEAEVNGVRMTVDLWHGQKTGLFLDQRENQARARTLARGRILDAFSYQGGFGLAAAARAGEVIAVDASAPALQTLRSDAERNGFRNVRTVEGNVFDLLKERDRAGERFDTIFLDPPAFAKNRAELPGAVRGYKEINLRAIKLLSPGGVLFTSSCSFHLPEALFEEIVAHAAADAGVSLRVKERRGQSADHPMLLEFPESRYLKCIVLERPEAR
jgi:23S rRNA (cytosine1962-C5)-methyltransferase